MSAREFEEYSDDLKEIIKEYEKNFDTYFPDFQFGTQEEMLKAIKESISSGIMIEPDLDTRY